MINEHKKDSCIGSLYDQNDMIRDDNVLMTLMTLNIVYNFISNELYEKIKNELSYKKEELLYNNRLYIIKNLFNFLKQGGNFILCLISFYNSEIIDIYYILSYMFDCLIVSIENLSSISPLEIKIC